MKEEQQELNSRHLGGGGGGQRNKHNMKRLFSFLIVFFLGFGFGFFSRSSVTTIPSVVKNQPCPTIAVNRTKQQQQKLRPSRQENQSAVANDLLEFQSVCAPPIPASEIIPTIFTKLYNNTSPYLNFPPPHLNSVLHPRRVRGWGSTGSVFETLIKSTKPTTIIEVGTFLGASTLHMANLTRSVGLPDTLILCLDDFRGWPGFRDLNNGIFRHLVDINGDVILMQQFMQNIIDAREESRILPVPFSTSAGLDALCEWGIYGDLVEVDAGHDFHSAWADINRAWKVLSPGGVLFGHDYRLAKDNHGVKRAVDLFAKTRNLRVKPDGQHWVLLPPRTKKQS